MIVDNELIIVFDLSFLVFFDEENLCPINGYTAQSSVYNFYALAMENYAISCSSQTKNYAISCSSQTQNYANSCSSTTQNYAISCSSQTQNLHFLAVHACMYRLNALSLQP